MHIDSAWHKHYAHALSGYASVHGVNTKDHMVRDIIFYLRHREPKLCYPEGDYRNVFTKEDAWLLRYRVGQRAYLNLKRGVIGAAGMVVVLAAIVVFFEGISSLQQKQHMRDCIATKIAGSGLHTDTAVERYQHACIREFETRAELESG